MVRQPYLGAGSQGIPASEDRIASLKKESLQQSISTTTTATKRKS